VAGIFGPGTSTEDIVQFIQRMVEARAGAAG
jgi:methylmalonyl-CoA mutase cobalamin-binding subunit